MVVKYRFCIAVLGVLTVNLSQRQCSEETWTYSGEYGPSHWGGECNTGNEQSPIDIPKNMTHHPNQYNGLFYIGYEVPLLGKIANNGHSVQITPTDGRTRRLLLEESFDYDLQQFHFHFGNGSNKSEGSEHKIHGKGYAMEMHLVHKCGNDLAVLGVLFEETSEDNKKLSPLIKAVNKVEYKGDTAELPEPILLNDILSACHNTFYMYKGSTTTPPCQQNVRWTILKVPVPISTEQLKAFRNQQALSKQDSVIGGCASIAGNFRPLQPLNGRIVHLYGSSCKTDKCNNLLK